MNQEEYIQSLERLNYEKGSTIEALKKLLDDKDLELSGQSLRILNLMKQRDDVYEELKRVENQCEEYVNEILKLNEKEEVNG
jgi:hypothetical protein